MKKLMMTVAIVCATVAVNAATVSWKSGVMYSSADDKGTPGDTSALKYGATGHKGTIYLFYFDNATDYSNAQALSTSKLYENYILNTATAATAKSTANASSYGATIKFTDAPDGSAGNAVNVYGMMIFVDTQTAASYDNVDAFVKTAFGNKSYEDTTGVEFTNMGVAGNWTAYSAVPEPTSGLLLLLGVAGLALRRRRA